MYWILGTKPLGARLARLRLAAAVQSLLHLLAAEAS